MAAGRHLGFSKYRNSGEISNFCYAKVCAVQFQPQSSIHAEVINPSWIFKISHLNNFYMYIVFLHCSVKFGDNRPMHAKMASKYSMLLFCTEIPNHASLLALLG